MLVDKIRGLTPKYLHLGHQYICGFNDAKYAAADITETHLSVLIEALEIIAGKRQCMDNLMGNRDVALAALAYLERKKHDS